MHVCQGKCTYSPPRGPIYFKKVIYSRIHVPAVPHILYFKDILLPRRKIQLLFVFELSSRVHFNYCLLMSKKPLQICLNFCSSSTMVRSRNYWPKTLAWMSAPETAILHQFSKLQKLVTHLHVYELQNQEALQMPWKLSH